MNSSQYIELENQYGAHNYKPLDVVLSRDEGIWVRESQITARQLFERLAEKGILCKETHSYTIRFAPPLIIKKDEVDFVVNKIREALSD